MNRKQKQSGGAILVEFTVTLCLMMVLLGVLTETMLWIGKVNRLQWARQACTAAASAQLDSFQATGGPIDPDSAQRLWPRVDITIETAPGTGDWEGLTLVHVQAVRRTDRRDLLIEQSRYIRLQKEQQP